MKMTYEEFEKLPPEALLKPHEIAEAFRVDPKTVTRWSQAGKLEAIKTLGGHRRFRKIDVLRATAEAGRNVTQGVRQMPRGSQ